MCIYLRNSRKAKHSYNEQINPIPRARARGGGIYAPPTPFRQFSPDVLIRGGSNYTLNFVITEHLNLVSGKKNFPTARGKPPGRVVGWVVPVFAPFLPQNWL